ncbi:DUF4382 domain-containing protein [Halobium salinum]|uniref:DUF4382 domain-containing protein n=1 Tax=Halobium salinum TaxID=1364940 RepID=A0ABD5PG07_9EURY|nr:DUF4382 domain-containing protein [Halobium salinum]
METKLPLAVLTAVLVVLAGCTGGVGVDAGGSASVDESATTNGTTNAPDDAGDGDESDADATASGDGTVNFFVSDERNAIGDFASLNVTISKVGLHRAGSERGDGPEGEADAEAGAETNASADATVAADANGSGVNASAAANATVKANVSADANASATAEGGAGAGAESADDEESKGGWVEHEVGNATVDLTELQGAKASRLGSFAAESGQYDRVFVYVSEVEGTLTTGETVRVKLPSGKLHVKREFAVGAGSAVDFVFDITVFEAGNSGKYVLKPVVGESGTGDQVDIEDVSADADENAPDGDANATPTTGPVVTTATATPNDTAGGNGALDARFEGSVRAGTDATLVVTRGGDPVEGAAVLTGGDAVARTDADGRASVPVPVGAGELTVTVEQDGETATATKTVAGVGGGSGNGGD